MNLTLLSSAQHIEMFVIMIHINNQSYLQGNVQSHLLRAVQ